MYGEYTEISNCVGSFSSPFTCKGCENHYLLPYTAKAAKQKTFTYRGKQKTVYALLTTLPLT